MNPLIALICRILSGEKLEPVTRRNTAFWLSGLVVVPIVMVVFASLARWLESAMELAFDNVFFLTAFMIVAGLVTLGAKFSLARICIGRPGLLVVLSGASWGLLGFLMLRST